MCIYQANENKLCIKMDKSLIINRIKSHYNFNNAELARFLGIKPQVLSNWISRNTIDYDLIYTKCLGISGDWLLSGSGEMFNAVEKSTHSGLEAVEELKAANNDLKDIIIQLQRELIGLQKEVQSLREKDQRKSSTDVSARPVP